MHLLLSVARATCLWDIETHSSATPISSQSATISYARPSTGRGREPSAWPINPSRSITSRIAAATLQHGSRSTFHLDAYSQCFFKQFVVLAVGRGQAKRFFV